MNMRHRNCELSNSDMPVVGSFKGRFLPIFFSGSKFGTVNKSKMFLDCLS